MNLPAFDKALVFLITILCIAATDGMARADPPPTVCDEFCRERRYFKDRDADDTITCQLWKYRTCVPCVNGQCAGNAQEDLLTAGKCTKQDVNQWIPKTAPEKCDAMCPFPVAAGAAVREAVEQPTTYSGIGAGDWVEIADLKVRKCLVDGEPYKEWTGEGVKWNQKKDEEINRLDER